MKTIKLLLLAFTLIVSLAATCEPEEQQVAVPEVCNCHIEGTKEISTDGGVTWHYAGIDERSGLLFPCSADSTYTEINSGTSVRHRTFWKCTD